MDKAGKIPGRDDLTGCGEGPAHMNGDADYGFDRIPFICDDGSETIRSVTFGETYHSSGGSVRESCHVYIENGLGTFLRNNAGKPGGQIHILEAGMGSGLDILLTVLRNRMPDMASSGFSLKYTALELYPLRENEWNIFDFSRETSEIFPGAASEEETGEIFRKIHMCPWEEECRIDDRFMLSKKRADISDTETYTDNASHGIDVCFFDAFSPGSQPELWSEEVFSAIYSVMNPGGILSTYSAKGSVKENLRNAGFLVKRVKGFGNKRHMVTAFR